MKKELIQKILADTLFGYDFMAEKFSQTRKYFWRDLEFIKEYSKDDDKILDFGCGNGRLLEILSEKNICYYGVDVSEKLIEIAKSKYLSENTSFLKLDPSQESLPFADNFFNAVYSVAVFHHFPGKEYRKQMAKELFRITKPGGYVVVTVWNLWSKKYIRNIIANWQNKLFGKSNLDWNDCQIIFKDNEGNDFKRYHHAFRNREIENLFSKAGFMTEILKKGKNIIYIGRKLNV